MVFTKSGLSNFKTSPNFMFPILENQQSTVAIFDIVTGILFPIPDNQNKFHLPLQIELHALKST